MDAKTRNRLAAQSRRTGIGSTIEQNRTDHAAKTASLRDRQNRHTAAPTDSILSAAYAGRRKNRRPGRDKGQNEWRSTGPYYRTAATHDIRWSQTATRNVPDPGR